ncbi:MAG: hypothetical protein AB1589_19905 [Cyanobacteriota bacterium]
MKGRWLAVRVIENNASSQLRHMTEAIALIGNSQSEVGNTTIYQDLCINSTNVV